MSFVRTGRSEEVENAKKPTAAAACQEFFLKPRVVVDRYGKRVLRGASLLIKGFCP